MPGRARRERSSDRAPRLRFALVGCGGMGRTHMRHLLEIPEVEAAALCDTAKGRVQRYVKEFFPRGTGRPAVYTDYERLLSSERLDAVVLVTPHAEHFPQARAALEAGLHVLVEKPMVTNAEHARDLVRLAERKERLLGIAFQGPVSAEFAYISNLIRRGDLGELQSAVGYVAQDWMSLSRGTWRQNPKLSGGGMTFDTGAHLLNAALWLVDSPVRRVAATLDRLGSKVDINATIAIRFENGCLASLSCAGNACGPIDSLLAIYGTKGTVKTGAWGGALEHVDAAHEQVRYPYMPYATVSPHRNFVDAIRGHDALRCPPAYGVLLAELMEAVFESAETGRAVEVRSEK